MYSTYTEYCLRKVQWYEHIKYTGHAYTHVHIHMHPCLWKKAWFSPSIQLLLFFSISLLRNVISNDEHLEINTISPFLSTTSFQNTCDSYHRWKFWKLYNLQLFHSNLDFEYFLSNSVPLRCSHCRLTRAWFYWTYNVLFFGSRLHQFTKLPCFFLNVYCKPIFPGLFWDVWVAPVLWRKQWTFSIGQHLNFYFHVNFTSPPQFPSTCLLPLFHSLSQIILLLSILNIPVNCPI